MARKPMLGVVCFLAVLMAGCATGYNRGGRVGDMLSGKIIRLSTGLILPMQIQLSRNGAGQMTATNPKTGELFDGTYRAISENKTIQYSKNSFWGNTKTETAQEVSNMVPASAVLIGNKGTVLNIQMKIQPGNPPIGYGEAQDNKGRKYSVQF